MERRLWIFIASHGGDAVCLEVSTEAVPAAVRWTFATGEHVEGTMVAFPAASLVYLATYRAVDRHGQGAVGDEEEEEEEVVDEMPLGCLYALDLCTGALRWSRQHRGECKAPPAVAAQLGAVFAADYAGEVVRYDALSGERRGVCQVDGAVFAAPVLSPDERWLCIATTRGHLFLCDVLDGKLECKQHFDCQSAIFSTPAFCAEGIFCAAADGSLRLLSLDAADQSLDAESAEYVAEMQPRWESYACPAPFFSSAAIWGSLALLGCHDGKLRCVCLQSGEILQEIAFQTALFASPFLYRTAEGEVRAACASTAGDVFVVALGCDASAPQFMTLCSTVRLPAEIFSSPVVGPAGDVFVGCRDDRLYCLA